MVRAQTYTRWELVVLDTDGPQSPFFASLRDDRVAYHHDASASWTHVGAKRNRLLNLARGEIVAIFDDDNVCGSKGGIASMSTCRQRGRRPHANAATPSLRLAAGTRRATSRPWCRTYRRPRRTLQSRTTRRGRGVAARSAEYSRDLAPPCRYWARARTSAGCGAGTATTPRGADGVSRTRRTSAARRSSSAATRPSPCSVFRPSRARPRRGSAAGVDAVFFSRRVRRVAIPRAGRGGAAGDTWIFPGEEGPFFNGRVFHDVFDDRGVFAKIHHGQNASSTPVTEDVPESRVPRDLRDLVRRHAPLYARDKVFTGAFADKRGDLVAEVQLGHDREWWSKL